jgi:tRNA-splicing ligase RtcB (3'-phosphate/5'-hydroxy nucleic acid ligase)
MLVADPSKVSTRAKKPHSSGGRLAVEPATMRMFRWSMKCLTRQRRNAWASRVGPVCIMIHAGSRGLGRQVAIDALVKMEQAAAARDNI